MTQKEKLVELLSYFADGYSVENRHICYGTLVNEIASYLIENGVIVPPCKVGDTVWEIEDPFFEDDDKGTVVESKVEQFYIGTSLDLIEMKDFGTYIFLTKEEAEKALAEKRTENG